MTKDDIQQQALDYSKEYDYLALQFATGVGKSLASIKIIEEHGGEWYIVIAELLHKQNWIDEFNKKLITEIDTKISKKEYASHFSRWLPGEILKSKNQNGKSNTEPSLNRNR